MARADDVATVAGPACPADACAIVPPATGQHELAVPLAAGERAVLPCPCVGFALAVRGVANAALIGCTGIMRRMGILVVAALLAAAGCGSNSKQNPPAQPQTPAASTPASASSASATPSASPVEAIEFTVDGAGPYQLGAMLASLQADGLLDEVKVGGEVCPENTTARGTGVWQDIRLSFRKDGKLYLAVNRSPSIPTPSGAWLGTTLAQLKTIYAAVSTQELTQGGGSAYLVTTLSGRGILFDLDPSKKVFSMVAGDAAYLKSSYQGGTDFC